MIALPTVVRVVNGQNQPDIVAGARSINDSGAIVGFSGPDTFNTDGDFTAFVYFWCSPPGGLPLRTAINLSQLAGYSLDSEAWDINASNVIVGDQRVVNSPAETRGFVWDLSQTPHEYIPLGVFLEGKPGSFARSINDDANPTIVGFSSTDNGCFGGGDPNTLPPINRAFWWPRDGVPNQLNQLEPVFAEESYALAVASTQGAPPNSVVAVSGFIVDCGSQAEQCNPSYDPATWEAGSSSLAALPPEFVPSTDASRVTDRNDFGSLVGYRLYPVGNQCRTHALYWEDDWSDPVDLGAIGGYSEVDTEALGIQERTCDGVVRVVGRDATNDFGLIWTRNEQGSWSVATLNSIVSSVAEKITVGFEINRAGWIVGKSICSEERAALLRPLPAECTGDLDHTGLVGATDLALLLGAWGAGPICSSGPDIDLSGDVGASDLAILLGAWGVACACASPQVPNCSETAALASAIGLSEVPSPASLETVVQMLGFASVDSFAFWGLAASTEELDSFGTKLSILLKAVGGGA